MTTADPLIDLRCPITPRRLFARVRAGDASIDRATNLIEVACDDCKKAGRRLGHDVGLVLHRFDLLGECIETVTVPRLE